MNIELIDEKFRKTAKEWLDADGLVTLYIRYANAGGGTAAEAFDDYDDLMSCVSSLPFKTSIVLLKAPLNYWKEDSDSVISTYIPNEKGEIEKGCY